MAHLDRVLDAILTRNQALVVSRNLRVHADVDARVAGRVLAWLRILGASEPVAHGKWRVDIPRLREIRERHRASTNEVSP